MKNMKAKRFVINKVALSLLPICLLLPVYSFAQAAGQEIRISRDIEYSIAVNHKKKPESLLLDIYQLPKLNQAKRPVIILVHGGGFGSGDKGYTESQGSFYPDLAKAFAYHGYVACSVNYRLWQDCPVDSFHIELENAVSDVLAAVNWIKIRYAEYGIDSTKIIIAGDSAGGGIVVNASCNSTNQLIFAGCIDLWGGLPPYGMNKAKCDVINVKPLGAFFPPCCIIHGTADAVVPYCISKNLSETLTSTGVFNELYPLPGAGHYPTDLAGQIEKIMLAFSDKIVSGEIVTIH
jgi:acetyl esterase/lipase